MQGYPAATHTEAFDIAHRNFLAKTVHAGEAFGPESIFQVLLLLLKWRLKRLLAKYIFCEGTNNDKI